ncbi:MAG: universal stress protein [Candidatus Bathyarchaeia archaeon]|jgi:nucleotide-binding universal stress UspA family protein
MFRKILFPTDFSDTSNKVIPYLKYLQSIGKIHETEEVVILHVLDTYLRTPFLYAANAFLTVVDKMMIEAKEAASEVAKTLNDVGIKTNVRIEQGLPLHEILRVEIEEDADLIVIGSHGRSNIEEMLLGSVSENVIRKSKAPVLVVKR